MPRRLFVLLITALASVAAAAQDAPEQIRLNQIGFYPTAPKAAVVVDAPTDAFYITSTDGVDTLYAGTLGVERRWTASGEYLRIADFSALGTPGTYVVAVPSLGTSYRFVIDGDVHRPVAAAALKGYYFQRMSMPLTDEYAGAWARPAGHPDDVVWIHASAASAERPTNTRISAPKGWYDAGDFNKYIVNSGITTYTLLAFLEHYPAFAETLTVDIPETSNALPDVLDEVLWNVRWMLAMQDPHDGGVYHKLTHANFQGVVMPDRARATRYVVQKSTAATLDFAAVMAQGARIAASYPEALPGLADSLRTAALAAWTWARANPRVLYNQQALNAAFNPDIQTGEYGDGNVTDEFAWAAAELFVTTDADSFLTVASPLASGPDVPWWGGVRALGWYTLLHHRRHIAAAVDTTELKRRYLQFADGLTRNLTPYGTVMGRTTGDFVWGSNAVAANQGMALVQAFRLSRDSTYLWAALGNLDYLLGRNATGYSFVTGHGDRTPMHPHHRASEADGIAAPVPGLLAGGPNPGQQDGCSYPSSLPARSYVDDWCSYASNEIAINWNAPLVYLSGAIEATLAGSTLPSARDPLGQSDVTPTLRPPYPNPAGTETTLTFSLADAGVVVLDAFDLLGRQVAAWPPRHYARGHHRLAWSLSDLPAGAYLVRLTSAGRTESRWVVKMGS